MPTSGSGQALIARRRALLERCSRGEVDAPALVQFLSASPRTVAADLAWAKAQFPGEFLARTDSDHRRFFRFTGQLPVLLERPIEWLGGMEFIALVAARGLLRLPSDGATESAESPYGGLLDGALDGLLRRLGVRTLVRDVAPEAIQVSRFGARPEDPTILGRVMAATIRQEGLRFNYLNRWNEAHPVHAAPRRLVLIRGEFHCFMWTPRGPGDDRPRRGEIGRRRRRGVEQPNGSALTLSGLPGADGLCPAGPGRIKQYRVSRMTDVEQTQELPRGCPVEPRQRRIDKELAEAFETTGSSEPDARVLVRLAVSPEAFPHLEGRTFGGEQRWSESGQAHTSEANPTRPDRQPSPPRLPAEWRRLEFFTTGLDACKYWVLGFGRGVRAEHPPELVRWLRDEVAAMARGLRGAEWTSGDRRGRSGEDERADGFGALSAEPTIGQASAAIGHGLRPSRAGGRGRTDEAEWSQQRPSGGRVRRA